MATNDEAALEQRIQAEGLNAPRLTPALIDAAIDRVQFHVFEGSQLTVCCLTLKNGFTVTGESACVSPANFKQQIGEEVAFKDARQKIWALEGYLLKQRLFEQAGAAERIARVAHEVNRAYCQALGDTSQPSWEDAPEWQRASAIKGVEFHLANPDASASASHDSWLEQKRADGWEYGPVKDPEKKQHPCFVPFEALPVEQQAKDHLFRGVVHALAGQPT